MTITPDHPLAQRVLTLLQDGNAKWHTRSASDLCLRHSSGLVVICDSEASEGPASVAIITPDGAHYRLPLQRAGLLRFRANPDQPFVQVCDRVMRRARAEADRRLMDKLV